MTITPPFNKLVPVALVLLAISFNVNACPEIDTPFEPKTSSIELTSLCRAEFELGYSVKHKLALWGGERLTGAEASDTEPRLSLFKADPDLKKGTRAEMSDYVNSHKDRGHIVPAGDMHTLQGMTESFYLSNMMPQQPNNNRGIWKVLERYAKEVAKARGEVLIFTGPILQKSGGRTIGPNSIPVPRAMYKIIFDVKTKESWSFIVPNEKLSANLLPKKIVKLADIEQETGLKFLSNVKDKKEQTKMLEQF